jgi:hypothetical protein
MMHHWYLVRRTSYQFGPVLQVTVACKILPTTGSHIFSHNSICICVSYVLLYFLLIVRRVAGTGPTKYYVYQVPGTTYSYLLLSSTCTVLYYTSYGHGILAPGTVPDTRAGSLQYHGTSTVRRTTHDAKRKPTNAG